MLHQVLLFSALTVPSSFFLSSWKRDNWHDLTTEIQSHLESVVAGKLSQLFWDLYENCGRDQKLFIKLFILNETSTTNFEERTVWERKEAQCFGSVFDASDEVLKSWCTDKPDRMLLFSYEYSQSIKKLIWSKKDSYEALVQTNCLFFQSGEDYPRLPLPWPFNFRQDHTKTFLMYVVLVIALFVISFFFYCHRCLVYQFFRGIWTVYRDRRDWNAINAVIEFRNQRIKEEHERRQKTVQTTAL